MKYYCVFHIFSIVVPMQFHSTFQKWSKGILVHFPNEHSLLETKFLSAVIAVDTFHLNCELWVRSQKSNNSLKDYELFTFFSKFLFICTSKSVPSWLPKNSEKSVTRLLYFWYLIMTSFSNERICLNNCVFTMDVRRY